MGDVSFMNIFKIENLPSNLATNAPYDRSQYDANWKRKDDHEEKSFLMQPQQAAEIILSTDDSINYEEAWIIIREMADNDTYRDEVLQYAKKILKTRTKTTEAAYNRSASAAKTTTPTTPNRPR